MSDETVWGEAKGEVWRDIDLQYDRRIQRLEQVVERLRAALDDVDNRRDEYALKRQKAFDDGITVERERCAKIAEAFFEKTDWSIAIAHAIRKGE